MALGGAKRPSVVEKANPPAPAPQVGASDFARPTMASSSGGLRKASAEPAPARHVGSEDSPLRKDHTRSRVQPSGRVFGQPPAKTGIAAAVRQSESAARQSQPRSARSLEEAAAAAERRGEVKPHPLLPSKPTRPVAPPPEAAEKQISREDLAEDPLAPTAPLLLRRSRGDE